VSKRAKAESPRRERASRRNAGILDQDRGAPAPSQIGTQAEEETMKRSSSPHDHAIARRTLLKGAGLGAGAGLVGGFTSAGKAGADTETAAPADNAPVWSGEYWAKKGEGKNEVRLSLWRKRIGAPKAGEPPLPVLFLVHGSSNSARTSFDLAVAGKGEYSLMNVFARHGYDVLTMDHDGYGRSGSSGNNSDTASSVADLEAAMPVLRRESGRSKFHFYGTSSGAIRAAAFAQAQPDAVDRLVLVAFTYRGTGSPTLRDRAKQVEFYRANNRRTRDRAMIRSIFTRDNLASSYDMAVAEAIADEELKFGDQVPTGTYLDMTANLPLVDPAKILAPVAIIRGDHDGIATTEDLLDFYRQLPNGDRVFISLPRTAHSPGYANNRHLLWYATRSFLAAPAPAAS
jgi:alpha-beta hydrolase superfamily lysophospholipase